MPTAAGDGGWRSASRGDPWFTSAPRKASTALQGGTCESRRIAMKVGRAGEVCRDALGIQRGRTSAGRFPREPSAMRRDGESARASCPAAEPLSKASRGGGWRSSPRPRRDGPGCPRDDLPRQTLASTHGCRGPHMQYTRTVFRAPRLPDVTAVLVIAFASAALSSGCAMRPAQPSPVARPPAQASPRPVSRAQATVNPPSVEWLQKGAFADLPVPPGFELESDESFVFLQGSIRSADLNYIGDGPISELIRFYQDEMPPFWWQFVRLTGIDMKTLTYSNGIEICEIILERHSEHSPAAHTSGTEERHQAVSAGPEDTPKLQTHLHIKLHER